MIYTLTSANQGEVLELRPADRLLIRLPENPTTGFQWAVDTIDDRFVGVQSATYEIASNAGIGGGGTRLFRLVAKQAGVTQVRLKLWREWLGDSSVTQWYQLTIRVLA
ncbi:MAG: protease inhibitor I42 family protein [Caldilineaceae bacterium]